MPYRQIFGIKKLLVDLETLILLCFFYRVAVEVL